MKHKHFINDHRPQHIISWHIIDILFGSKRAWRSIGPLCTGLAWGPVSTLRDLMSTTVDILCFHYHLYNPWEPAVKSKICFQFCSTHICCDLNFTNNTNFQSLEVVDRASETQLQVAENLNFLLSALRVNPLTAGAAYIRVFIFISTLSTTFWTY